MITDKYRCDWAQAVIYNSGKALEYLDVLPILISDIKGKKVLDYGCGGGRDLFVFNYYGAECFGTDVVKSNLKFAKSKVPNARFVYLNDNNNTPFSDNMFDIINCNGVLHHIDNVNEVIDELYRVLKPDGVMYVMLYSENLMKKFEKEINEKMKSNGCSFEQAFGCITDDCEYTEYYDVEKAGKLFEKFEIVEHKLYFNDCFRIYKLKKKVL